jgi:hypothetical protein
MFTMSRSHQFFRDKTASQTANESSFKRKKNNAQQARIDESRQKMSAALNVYASLQPTLARLSSITAKVQQPGSEEVPTITAINPLAYELEDITRMVACVASANINTMNLIYKLHELAADAADGTHSVDELKNLDRTFQALKKYIRYAQTVNLIAGPKELGGGAIKVVMGELNELTIPLDPIDIKSLGIEKCNILTVDNALDTMDALIDALNIVIKNLVVAPVLMDDAISMIQTIPYALNQTIQLFNSMKELTMLAATGTTPDADRALIDLVFNSLKTEMDKLQTVVTDNGIKHLGEGKLHLQVGNALSDATSICIPLPITDVVALGLDKNNLLTQQNALETLTALNDALRNLIYTQANHHVHENLETPIATDDDFTEEEENEEDRSYTLRL